MGKQKKLNKFPLTILITREKDGDSSYLLQHDTLDSIDHGTVVAQYDLVGVSRANVERSLVDN